MTLDMNNAIAFMRSLQSRGVTYSMGGSRTGADGTADCSGAVYSALNHAGGKFAIGNTESEFVDLPAFGFQKVNAPFKIGDIFIFGVQGSSSGAAGHTGIFVNADKIIHCNYGSNGVSVDNFNAVRTGSGNPPFTVLRLGNQKNTQGGDVAKEKPAGKNMENGGEIEELWKNGNTLHVKGWHFSNSGTVSSSGTDKSTGTGSNGSVDWNSVQARAQFFVNVCVDIGISNKNAILGLCANAFAESSLDPSALEPMEPSGAQGHGYLQWSYPYNWGGVPNHMSRSYDDAKFQLKWARDNAKQWIDIGRGTFEGYWNSDKPPQEKTTDWIASWERPAHIVDRWTPFTQAVNVSSLTFKGLSDSKVPAPVTSKPVPQFAEEFCEIYDATNDKLLKSVKVEILKRQDIADENPDIDGILFCGFDFETEINADNPIYIKMIRIAGDGTRKVMQSDGIVFPRTVARKDIGTDFCKGKCRFQVVITYQNGNQDYVTQVIDGFSWTNGIGTVPSCDFTVPIDEAYKFDGHAEAKLLIDNKMFDGIVKQISLNKKQETATISLDHVISEWDYRQIPENIGVKNKTFPFVFSQNPFLYSDKWYIEYDKHANSEKINYVFSHQGHFEALSKSVELTDKLYWRVGFRYDRYLEIGAFGEKKNYILTDKARGLGNRLLITGAPEITKNFDSVFNVATVYGEKSDSGQASLTLREAFLDQNQSGKDIVEGFPIVVLNPTVNSEQANYYTNITKIASNNLLEFAIVDEFSVNLEQGKLIEKTVPLNDVAPFENDGDKISDEERAKQSHIAYKATVKALKNARRADEIKVPIGSLPCDVNVLDMIYFDYENCVQLFDKCSRKVRKVYKQSGYFYITNIETSFDNNLNESNLITLSKELRRKADSL